MNPDSNPIHPPAVMNSDSDPIHPPAMTNSDSDDLTEEEEVEEKLVFVELDNKQTFEGEVEIQFLGLEHAEPVVSINGVTYKGNWEDALGTLLFLDGMPPERAKAFYNPVMTKPLDDTIFEIKHKTDKILKMSRCVIVKNREVEPDLRQVIKSGRDLDEESSEEENIEEVYAAMYKDQEEPGEAEDVAEGLLSMPTLVPAASSKSLYRFSATVQPKRKPGLLKHLKGKTCDGTGGKGRARVTTARDPSDLEASSEAQQESDDPLMGSPQNPSSEEEHDPLVVIKTESPDTSMFSQMSVQSLLEHSQNTLENISNSTFLDSTLGSGSPDESRAAAAARGGDASSSQTPDVDSDASSPSKFDG